MKFTKPLFKLGHYHLNYNRQISKVALPFGFLNRNFRFDESRIAMLFRHIKTETNHDNVSRKIPFSFSDIVARLLLNSSNAHFKSDLAKGHLWNPFLPKKRRQENCFVLSCIFVRCDSLIALFRLCYVLVVLTPIVVSHYVIISPNLHPIRSYHNRQPKILSLNLRNKVV